MGSPFLDTMFVTTGFLNTANDPNIGASVSPDGFAKYPDLLGKILALNHRDAARYCDTTIGPLKGGWYQYVKAGSALARGDIVGWDTLANNGLTNYQVTHTITAAMESFLAGIALCTVTSGNYGWIQVAGLANVQYRAAVTAKTLGNIVVQLTTTATADAIADGTGSWIGGGVLGLKNIIGGAHELPADGAIKLVTLKNLHLNF